MWRDDVGVARALGVTGHLLSQDRSPLSEQQPVLRIYRYADNHDEIATLDRYGGLSGPVRAFRGLTEAGFVWPQGRPRDVTVELGALGFSPPSFVEALPDKFVQPTHVYAARIGSAHAARLLIVTAEARDDPGGRVIAGFFCMSADGRAFAQTHVSNLGRHEIARAAGLIGAMMLQD